MFPAEIVLLAADGFDSLAVTLSPHSRVLIALMLPDLSRRENWSKNGIAVSDSEWDEISAYIAELGEL